MQHFSLLGPPGTAWQRGWFVLLLLLLGPGAMAQTSTIGSTAVPVVAPATSSNFYGPLYRSTAGSTFNYSRYAHLYTPAELNVPSGSVITQLAWLKSNAGTLTGSNVFTVQLANSAQATLGTTQPWSALTTGATQVYTSTTQQVTGAAGDYFSVTLSQPFVYTGGNLLVLTDHEKQGTASGAINFVTNPAVGYALGFADGSALTAATALTAVSYGDRRPTLRVTYTPGGPCTTPPNAGTTLASATSACAGAVVSFSLQGATSGTGQTYQWQVSTNGTTFADIAGATGQTYTSGPLTATRTFRAVISCSGQTATSTPATVTVTAATYATLPVAEGFEGTWVDACATRDIPSNSWRNNPSSGNASWRRDDDGAAANWTSATTGGYTPTGSAGTRSARFHSYGAAATNSGTLDLYVNLSPAGTKVLQFDYVNTAGNDSLFVEASTDGGATFGAPLLKLGISGTVAQGWQPQSVSLTSTSTTALVRFRTKVTTTLTSDIGLDNVRVAVLTGVPTCATALTPAAGATGASRNTPITWQPGTGITTGYDVYFGTTATPPLVSTNQNSTSYTPTTLLAAATTYYYQVVPRNANGPAVGCGVQSFTTNSVPVYCDPSTTNLGGICGGNNVTQVTVGNSGLNATGLTCTTVPNGVGTGTSAYTSYPVAGTTTGTLLQGLTYPLTVTSNGASIMSVWVDYNQNGTFEATEWTQIAAASTANTAVTVNITVPPTATLGLTGLRVRSRGTGSPNGAGDACTNFASGETKDFVVTIGAAPSCAPPTALLATNLSTTSATLSYSAGNGTATSYVVQYGPAGFNPAQPSSATNPYTSVTTTALTVPATGLTANTAYQFYVTKSCGAGQTSQTAGPANFTTLCAAPVYATLPVTESFETTWVDGCGTRDVPANTWRNTPPTGNNSWRREDDPASAAWGNPTLGLYTPAFSQGAHSARFHSGEASLGQIGTLDLFVNLSAAGAKRLSFDYINTSGS
ncbi:MAG TPA: GEVED domain-containing protein, partial [Hymenobacter sp.]|uniref:GEVED domain-containing protein n=1 Tax=Hymenobacter sp. TaxID=1898978 RepID=UPI002ED8A9EB